MSESRDELGDADIISSGGRDFGAFWARVIRSRWARVAAIPVLAGLVAATALLVPLVPRPHPATRPAAPGQQGAITNTTAGLGPGTFAAGTAGGRQWQLDVQDIADPGFRCLPGVSIDGNDAYPLFAGQHPQSPVGDPAFVTLGSQLPGVGFAFIRVPADADWLWADPVGGFQLGPVSTPEGPSTITVLPVGSPRPGSQGMGYAISVGSGTDHLTAELSDGSNVSARPIVVGGRKYAAFFVPAALRMFWLNWVDANDRPIAGFTGLPGYGFMQFWPNGLPAMKTEVWSTSWAN